MALPIRGSQQPSPHVPMIHPIELMHREFDDLLSRFFGVGPLSTNALPASAGTLAAFGTAGYAVDVREDDKHVYIDADLPGFKKEDIDISIDDRNLTISAEHREETTEPAQAAQQTQQQGQQKQQKQQQLQRPEEQKGQYLLRERHYQRFTRSFTLPQNVDDQNVQAKLENGVLKVMLNKVQESKPKKIQVS